MRTILQIPVEKQLRDRATRAVSRQGFSSLQEVVRVFLNQIASDEMRISFTSPSVTLSSRNERRYARTLNNIASGKEKTQRFADVHAMIDALSK